MPDQKFDEKFVDPNTGETVIRIKSPEALTPEIDKHIAANAQHANNFMQISRQIVQMQKKQVEEFDNASKSEESVGKEVIRIREKMGLDSGWIYNIGLKMMEKREPPADTKMIGDK